ncbi:MAG TPA: helix-turn-helix transcriptional regulator [Pyrinomonadaceae bacterium]|nr:helix-turn-helix transcriptional regulator [Pyrinomonadaceae bacterium]
MVNENEKTHNPEEPVHIMTIDCCEHITAMIRNSKCARLTSVDSRGNGDIINRHDAIDFIVIGAPNYPVRRPFISQIREAYTDVPILILRRVDVKGSDEEIIRGEFVLSDQCHKNDLDLVSAVRKVLPLKPCEHTHKEFNFDTVRNVMRIIADNYSDPALDLEKVAKSLPISAAQLSHILNQEVGVSFRHLLRHTRIEEAKRLLASHRYSVKEVAVKVGFADSHYFSRTFKELTGQSASEYRSRDATLTG